MNISGAIKKLTGIVIFISELIMFWQSAEPMSLEILPEWHKWSSRLTIWLFAAFVLVSAALYLFQRIKGKYDMLFVLWGFVCLFTANTLYASGPVIQIVLTAALMLHMIHEGLFKSTESSATVLTVILICALLAALLIPSIGRIKKPPLYTTLENFWWDLFDTVTGHGDSGKPVALPNTEIDGGIPDNMITNDPFPEDDETPICTIKSTYPLQMLHIFSCGDYDPESFSFSILDDLAADSEQRSPSSYYFRQATGPAEELPFKAVITDHRYNKTMMPAPYCAFTSSSEGVLGFGDRFIYRYDAFSSDPARYTFDPGKFYKYSASSYSRHAQAEYLRLPEGLYEELQHYMNSRGMASDDLKLKDKVAMIKELLSSEYTYSNEPPELPDGEDPVLWFITESRTGYSKHFAAAEVFFYRALGIPARYSFGYNVLEYNDSEAEVLRKDAYAFCEIFADGTWVLPEYVLLDESEEDTWRIGQDIETEVNNTEENVHLSNDYDISHLKGTASMFGSYEGSPSFRIARNSVNENDFTVTLVVEAGMAVDYIKAYSTGDYSYPEGSFSKLSDIGSAPEFEEGKSFGEFAKDAFMSPKAADDQPEDAPGFRVFNLYAPRYIYAPVFPIYTEGLLKNSSESFGMSADRMIVPLSEGAGFDDYTLFKGSEAAGANSAYTEYALEKYTQVPEDMLFYLTRFLKENGIDPEDPDKGALLEAVRRLLSSYSYSKQIGPIPENEDPVLWFLTVSRSGYCQHFASSGTMLLRACGIPARFCAGYFKKLPGGMIAEITVQDAHAWTEVFDGHSWQLVEMTLGTPADGQVLPAGLWTGEQSFTLPTAGPKAVQKTSLPAWLIWIPILAALAGLAAYLAALIRRNKPDALQKAAIQYEYIHRYYYINEDTERLLNKICYSREGVQPEDIKALEQCCSRARSFVLYQKKYFTFAASLVLYAWWHLQAVYKNIRKKDN
ncbi:MAG: transglutaminase domain-containing protein [Firmicutes bacterium]|nr:transglutaminase domain-containing protein [Bacillota bacterium]